MNHQFLLMKVDPIDQKALVPANFLVFLLLSDLLLLLLPHDAVGCAGADGGVVEGGVVLGAAVGHIIQMSRNSLGGVGEPDKFELASVVTKNSRTGITSNRRLLVIKGGHLYYYSNVPKFFNGDPRILDNFHELPKCSISVLNIRKIKGFEPSSSYFSIEFAAKDMMEREDIRKTLANEDYNFAPKSSSEEVTWQFTCDNQFIKQRWVSALNNLKDYYRNEQANMQKYFDNLPASPPPDDHKSSNGSSSRSSIKIPWRESLIHRKSYNHEGTKGFEFKETSPKSDSNTLQQDVTSLKKGKSEDAKAFSSNRTDVDFEMLIGEDSKPEKIEEAFKVSPGKKVEEPKEKLIKLQPTIEEVPEDLSVPQTPLKDNSISYSDSEEPQERPMRASMERTLDDMKLYSETHPLTHIHPQPQLLSEPTAHIPRTLSIVEEKPELKSRDLELTPRSAFDSQSNLQRSRQEHSSKKSDDGMVSGSEFQWLLGASCDSGHKFEWRVENQRQLLSRMQNFKEKATEGLAGWVQSKGRGESRYRSTEQSSRVLLVEVGNMQLKVALLTTQSILINEKQRIFFNQDSIKNLKRQFKIYQNIFRFLTRRLRTEPQLKLRLPMAIYIEYKGVACIAFDYSIFEDTIQLGDDWGLERAVLAEEGYKLEWFQFRKLGRFLNIYVKTKSRNMEQDQENLKQYLKKIVRIGAPDKHHNLAFQPPIDRTFLQIATKERASTSIESLQRYVKGLRSARSLQGACPSQQIIAALQYCIYCKQLRKVYRSAQGEIDETHFFNLVFKQDASIKTLLEQSGCPPLPSLTGHLFSFIEHYFGVILEIDTKVYEQYQAGERKGKDLFVASTMRPLLRQYPNEGMQIIESFSKLRLYLQSGHELGLSALQKKKEVFYLSSESLSLDQAIQLAQDEASFHYHQADYISCIKKCREIVDICPPYHTKLLSIYLLMMKAYAEFSESDFTITLRNALQLIQFNYGPDHSSLLSLYSLAGHYYSKLARQSTQTSTPTLSQPSLPQVALKFAKQAQQLALRHFGNQSNQHLQVMLDLSRLYRASEPSTALAYLQQAKRLTQNCLALATSENILAILSYETELYLQMGLLPQAETALLSALTYEDAKLSSKTKRHLAKLQYQVGFYTEKYKYCEQAVERLWEMGSKEKLQALQLAYKTALRETTVTDTENLVDENDSARFEGRQRALVEIEEAKGGGLLVQLLVGAMEGKDVRLLTMVYYLLGN